MPNVLQVNPFALGIKGGVEVNLTYLSDNLIANGVSCTNLVGYVPPELSEFEGNQNVDSVLSPFSAESTIDPQSIERFEDADSIHLHNVHLLPGNKLNEILGGLVAANKLHKSHLHLHNLNGSDVENEFISRFNAEQINVYSDFMLGVAKKVLGVSARKLAVFFPSINGATQSPSKPISFLQPTRFDRAKGTLLSLLSAALLLEGGEEIDFIHAGIDYPKRVDKWNELADGLPADQAELILKWIQLGQIKLQLFDYESILGEIARCDVVLLPTTTEGMFGEPFSIAAVQSMLQRKYVISSISGNLQNFFNADCYDYSRIVDVTDNRELMEEMKHTVLSEMPPISEHAANWVKEFWESYKELRGQTIRYYIRSI